MLFFGVQAGWNTVSALIWLPEVHLLGEAVQLALPSLRLVTPV
jgi:hypothetical protein